MEMMNKKNQGFTLLEILVVVLITAVIMTILSGMFFSILQGSAKSRIMAEIKQNGGFALNVMERMIRSAKSVTGGGVSLSIVSQDYQTTTFECANNKIASNGAKLIDDTRVKVSNCTNIFAITPGELGRTPTTVVIDFILVQKDAAAPAKEASSMNFKSQIVLRNY